jgi:hypothetical protein
MTPKAKPATPKAEPAKSGAQKAAETAAGQEQSAQIMQKFLIVAALALTATFEEPGQPRPERQGVVAGFGQHALWQCTRARRLDLGPDLFQKRLGLLQALGMTSLSA